ncbi:uncharacterized protein LOC114530669 [Dendronephthya gigantea]|uniref:uncharacterized protein LOC114530669 n=1 Tax=Dendronephthya gigantea TaxID=151771 RepID=UPI00106B6955|nr:uncharacterized protein LOC114530669 [Dendronephthya gigantea]
MSRSVKDLRDMINISRLSFHGDESSFQNDDHEREDVVNAFIHINHSGQNSTFIKRNETTLRCITSTEHIDKQKSSLRNIRFKPLPAINSSTNINDGINSKENVEMAYQRSCNRILEYVDGSVVSSWLHRSNESVQWLSKWVSTKEYFVKFANFFLVEMDHQKQTELVEMEVEVILDEITFSVQDGLKQKKVSKDDVMSFFLLIIWEYPSKICGEHSSIFVLNTLVTLASAQKDKYRKLLSNVKFATKHPEQIHWILSVRAFALISIITAMVKFYSSLSGYIIVDQDVDKNAKELYQYPKTIQGFAFDAARLGYLDTLVYLVEQQDLNISGLQNKDMLSLLFCAVTCAQVEVAKYILETDESIDIKQVSKSGNSLLHAAVNTGDKQLVRLLLNAGADVNQTNRECNDVTPLHLAIMQDSCEIVQLLIDAGAHTALFSTDGGSTALRLAEDLQRISIVDLIKKAVCNDQK